MSDNNDCGCCEVPALFDTGGDLLKIALLPGTVRKLR
jgi:hypothetical protein